MPSHSQIFLVFFLNRKLRARLREAGEHIFINKRNLTEIKRTTSILWRSRCWQKCTIGTFLIPGFDIVSMAGKFYKNCNNWLQSWQVQVDLLLAAPQRVATTIQSFTSQARYLVILIEFLMWLCLFSGGENLVVMLLVLDMGLTDTWKMEQGLCWVGVVGCS